MSLSAAGRLVCTAAWPLCLAWAAVGCQGGDVGTLCQNANVALAPNPIVGESPVAQVINLTRDPNCLSFDCLTAQGLPSYCSRTCRYGTTPQQAATCQVDTDCKLPKHCFEGTCRDDDCPAGFFCEVPLTTGTLANTPYCMRQTHCLTAPDCGDVGTMECVRMGCYDGCAAAPASSCAHHVLVCAPLDTLQCSCAGAALSCSDPELTCHPPGAPAALAPGAVEQLGICMSKP